ncbi:MAG: Ig-like domain-containing protein, partial [Actinomycetota bacterium]
AAPANDEPKVSFCLPVAADGPNPSQVDEIEGDLRPPAENPDNLGTAGGETASSTDAQGKITIGIKIDPANGSDGSGVVNLVAFFETDINDDPDGGEPQDTATKTWFVAQGRTIDCEPETDTNATGTEHTVTCTVKDRDGEPVSGEGVTFTEEGPGTFTTQTQQTTNAEGTASATVTSDETGTETITGTITDDVTGAEPGEVDECDRPANDPQGAPAGVCADSVTKTWTAPQCSDGVDNDGDGKTDHPADPGCQNPNDNDETDEPPEEPECSDGVDNDGDGKTDFPDDPGCENAQDDDETDVEQPPDRVESDIKKFQHGSPFTGDVVSDKAKCERRRKVVVKKVTPGSDFKVGTDRTSRSGAFTVGHGGRAHGEGKFYAKVKKKRFTNNRGRVIVCEKARSRTIRVT